MRSMKLAVLAIFVVCVSLLSVAGRNQYGVSDVRQVTFQDDIKVGDVLLPKGEYKVEHTMEGTGHIVVFKQLRASHPATTRTKCQLVPLDKKAQFTEVLYTRDGETRV